MSEKGNIRSVSLSQYTSPHIEEERSKEWVQYRIKNQREYKHPNGYYDYLIDRASNSVTNGSVIAGCCKFIYGEGLTIENAAKNTDILVQIKSLIKPKDLKKAISDRKKLMMCAFQVTKESGKVKSITHFPMKTLLPEKMNEEGEIEAWYYNPDWQKDMQGKDTIRIPAFGFGGKSGNEIYIIRNYTAGSDYFGEDEGYSAALAYAVLEEEIADYQINDAQNGFTPTTIVNFNNGTPDDDQVKDDIVRDIYAKTTGATGKKVIVSFNDDETKKTTVEKVAIDDAPDHYAYLSEECEAKILKGHRAPSELLGFNSDSGGFANNAEELANKFKAFTNFEIQPFQMEFIDGLQEILAVNDISARLYFKQLMPFDFGTVEETPDQTTLSKEETVLETFINSFGEDCPDDWELVHSEEVDYQREEEEERRLAEKALKEAELSKAGFWKQFVNLLSTGTARPNRASEQDQLIDGDSYRVRYKYVGQTTTKTRPFCALMVRANKLYRKEDIIRMGNLAVNPGWGPGGANTYSIWKYKGGGNCHHKWLRQTFRVKGGEGSTLRGDEISTNQARREGYRPTNEKEVSMMPKDMPKQGFLK